MLHRLGLCTPSCMHVAPMSSDKFPISQEICPGQIGNLFHHGASGASAVKLTIHIYVSASAPAIPAHYEIPIRIPARKTITPPTTT